jgi:hypothetical protein
MVVDLIAFTEAKTLAEVRMGLKVCSPPFCLKCRLQELKGLQTKISAVQGTAVNSDGQTDIPGYVTTLLT